MKRIICAMLFLGSLSGLAQAESLKDKVYGNVVVDEVTSIYDADTFRVNIKSWPDVVGYRMAIRVNGVDAPEIRGKCQTEKDAAMIAKQFTVSALRGAKKIELNNIRRGKFFRLIADVYVDGRNLADMMIGEGIARPYHGGTRLGWCD